MQKSIVAAVLAFLLAAAVVAVACHGAGLDSRGWLVVVIAAALLVARYVYQHTGGKP